jgi:hypothetical protein
MVPLKNVILLLFWKESRIIITRQRRVMCDFCVFFRNSVKHLLILSRLPIHSSASNILLKLYDLWMKFSMLDLL